MWVEAVLLAEDLDRIIGEFAPMTIQLGAGHVLLTDPGPSVLVPGVGLRIACKGKAYWPVLGLEVPVTLESLNLLVRPEIATREGRDSLVVKLVIESVDLSGVLKMFDGRVTEMANKELLRKEVELSWGFAKTLTHSFPLPESIPPLESLDVTVVAGRVRVLDDGIGLAVQLASTVKRRAAGPSVAA